MGYVTSSSRVLYLIDGEYMGHCIKYLLSANDLLYVDIVAVDPKNPSNELKKMNISKYNLPLLMDRDICVNGYSVILEFLNEKYPEHQIIGDDLYKRVLARTQLNEIIGMLLNLSSFMENLTNNKLDESIKKQMKICISFLSGMIENKVFVNDKSLNCVDILLIPFLHRLDFWGFKFNKLPDNLKKYYNYNRSNIIFKRTLSAKDKQLMHD